MTQTIFWGKFSPFPNNKGHSVEKKTHQHFKTRELYPHLSFFFIVFGDRFSHTIDFWLIQALGLICLVLLRK